MKEGTVRMRGHADEVMNRPVTAAVIVAAGASTRMGVPSAHSPAGDSGHRVYLVRLRQAASIDEILLVARQEHMLQYYDIVKSYGIGKLTQIIPGGSSRQESAARGVYACHDDTAFFAVHDGARPLIRPEIIDAVAAAAYRDGAATAAVRVKDTVKVSNDGGFIAGTPTAAISGTSRHRRFSRGGCIWTPSNAPYRKAGTIPTTASWPEAAGLSRPSGRIGLREYQNYDARGCKRGGKPSAQAGGYAKRDGGGKWVCG